MKNILLLIIVVLSLISCQSKTVDNSVSITTVRVGDYFNINKEYYVFDRNNGTLSDWSYPNIHKADAVNTTYSVGYPYNNCICYYITVNNETGKVNSIWVKR